MSRLYTDDDVARWEAENSKSINLHLEKLSTNLPPAKIDFHLSMLELSYRSRALTEIAKNQFGLAIASHRFAPAARFFADDMSDSRPARAARWKQAITSRS